MVSTLQGLLVQSLPMAIFDCIFLKDRNDWQQSLQVLNGSFKLFVGLPLFQIFRKLDTLFTVFFRGFLHSSNLLDIDLNPKHFLEGIDFSNNLRVEVVEFFEVKQLSFSFLESRILLMLKSKQFFSFEVNFELMLSHFILLIKSFQSFDSFFRNDTFDHRAILLVICSKICNIFDQYLNIFFQSSQILSLLNCQISTYFLRYVDQSRPLGPKINSCITLVFVSDTSRQVSIK